ncbi:MAG: ferredoxin--NADP reductase [Thioalkalivibrionaceae bacterium]
MAYQPTTVTWAHPWAPKLFSFRVTRPEGFNFRNGEFVTLGLRGDGGPFTPRAYSIVSTNDEPELEFLSIHVPDGPLTSRLVNIKPGDTVHVNTKATGSLTASHVTGDRTCYLLATGTGLAPFMSLARADDLYQRFEHVVLVHSVRHVDELAYRESLEALQSLRPFTYVPTVTREPFVSNRRGAEWFLSGALNEERGWPQPDASRDAVLICGNPEMTDQTRDALLARGWHMTNHAGVGAFSVEIAFVLHHRDAA